MLIKHIKQIKLINMFKDNFSLRGENCLYPLKEKRKGAAGPAIEAVAVAS